MSSPWIVDDENVLFRWTMRLVLPPTTFVRGPSRQPPRRPRLVASGHAETATDESVAAIGPAAGEPGHGIGPAVPKDPPAVVQR